jgi:RNase P/RNase MRP subunit POP5
VKLGIQCVRTHWIRGFMAFQLVRRIQAVMLMVLACPESGFLRRAARPAATN